MKGLDTTGLNTAATVFVGILSSLVMVLLSGLQEAGTATPGSGYQLFVLAPIFICAAAAFFQYRFVMKPLQKELGELVSKTLNIQSSPQSLPPEGDKLALLRTSIESAASQVKEARERERMLIQYAADVICVIDLTGKIISVNPASRSVWGYNPQELKGNQITDFLASEDVANTMKALVSAEKSIEKIVFENRFRKKSGEIVDMLWSVHVSASDRGLFCIAHDITERKRAEAMLRESEERIRKILEDLPAGVALIDKNAKIAFMNRTAMQLSAYAAEDLSGLQAAQIFSFVKSSAFSFADIEHLSTGFDCQVFRSTGESLFVEASARDISWEREQAVLVIFIDATMKHEVETAKREFVAMVSHDLKTPLTTINLILSYLQDGMGGELSKDAGGLVRKGQESCLRLMNLVQDLLDLEKMRAGKFRMDVVDTGIREIAVAAIAAVEPYGGSLGVKIDLDCAEQLSCFCDGARIIQVLINLLGNAVKFSVPGGNVRLEIRQPDSQTVFSVSNRGKVIPADKLAIVFEKFEQSSAGGAEERKGTGLGLTIAKTIVEQHCGKIWAESSEEKGTCFYFTLPQKESD